MSQLSPGEPDPFEILQKRIAELGVAQERANEAIDHIPVVRNTVAAIDYNYQAGRLNDQLILKLAYSLTTDVWDNDGYKVRLPGIGALTAARVSVIFCGYKPPLYIIGEAKRDERFTDLLLFRKRSNSEPGDNTYTSYVNTAHWQYLKQRQEKHPGLTKNEIEHAYDPQTQAHWLRYDDSAALVPWRYSTEGGKRLNDTNNPKKVAKLHFAIGGAKHLETVEPEVHDRYAVTSHLVTLAGIFGQTALLNSLLSERAAAMPADPYEQLVHDPKIISTIEAGETIPVIEQTIDGLNDIY